jgi:hypothetical protein
MVAALIGAARVSKRSSLTELRRRTPDEHEVQHDGSRNEYGGAGDAFDDHGAHG